MRNFPLGILAFLCFGPAVCMWADVRLPPIISDHMVLARSHLAPIWGKADPGETVTAMVAGKVRTTVVGADGRWFVHLDLADSGSGPFQLMVKGRNEVVVSDVLVGTVWVASGQSNMEFPLQGSIGANEEIARSANANMRVFRVAKIGRRQPVEDCDGHWVVVGPESAGALTAVGYYFGKRLQRDLHVPVGIIDASWSGTYSELWMSEDAIQSVDTLRAGEAERRALVAEYTIQKQKFVEDYTAWLQNNNRADHFCPDPARFAGVGLSQEGWNTNHLPGKVFDEPFLGAAWIRRDVDIPEAALKTGRDFKVLLGDIEGFEQVYWNGTKVSETSYKTYPGAGYPRYFPIPPQLLRVGKNTIAVRIYAPAVSPKVTIDPDRFKGGAVSLAGDWLVIREYELPPLSSEAVQTIPKPLKQAPAGISSGIFNGVISPLTSYGVDGVLWYQGESDAARAYEYRMALRALISDWRTKWKQPHLPFYICQLHSYGPKKSSPGESEYAEVRESQAAALSLPETGMVVLFDLGESNDEHPRNKKEVGDRLATLVLVKQFGKRLVDTGPEYESMKVEGDGIRLRFRHNEGGLVARPLPPVYDISTLIGKTAPLVRNSPMSNVEGFSICGEDRRWVWADAKIDGNSVLVWSSRVPHPIAVRYGWADNPTVNLSNRSGWPAAPFRTDDFPSDTANKHYGLTP